MVWTPPRVGMSGDGRHGYTAGFMALRRPTGSQRAKYMAYWEKQRRDGGCWPTSARRPRPPAPLKPLASVLPKQIVRRPRMRQRSNSIAKSLADAETAFSSEAQTIGIGAAFTKYGSPDAIHLGGPDVPAFSPR